MVKRRRKSLLSLKDEKRHEKVVKPSFQVQQIMEMYIKGYPPAVIATKLKIDIDTVLRDLYAAKQTLIKEFHTAVLTNYALGWYRKIKLIDFLIQRLWEVLDNATSNADARKTSSLIFKFAGESKKEYIEARSRLRELFNEEIIYNDMPSFILEDVKQISRNSSEDQRI